MNTVEILDGKFAPLTMAETLEQIFDLIARGGRGYLCTVNVAILMIMRSNARLREFVSNAWLCVADGIPLIWASRLMRAPLPERVTGVDLVDRICEGASRRGLAVYFLGAKQEIVARVVQTLRHRYPALRIAGFADGYFNAEQATGRADAVRESGADILIVAMGVPRQEYFLEEHWTRLGVSFAIGVGGSFDVLAGLRKRAPAFLQNLGLEWAFRLCQEPRRLFVRYLVTNSQFLFLMTRTLLRGR